MSEPQLGAACLALMRRDLLLAYRHRAELVNPLLFFVIVVSLFPLGVSPESSVLRVMAPGVIWIAALLSILLSLDSLFRSDYEDGTLEQMLVSPHPLFVLVLTKVFTHWLVVGVPMVLFAPLLGLLMHLPSESMLVLLQTLLLGMPILSLIGSIGTALTLGLRRGSVLLSLLVLPLYVPVLIFGATAVDAAAVGLDVSGHISLLAALLVLSLTLAPFATSAALRVSSS
jgi:heme exporter protein B